VTGTTSLIDGLWHHYAGVITATGITLYIDGALIGTATVATPYVVPTIIGVGNQAGAPNFQWPGEIDEAVIWPTARYTAAFTPPTAAYAGTEGMVALYHLDSSGADSSTTSLTVVTPATTQASASLALNGTYSGTAPTGINYYFDSAVSYVAATGFTASGGAWSATGTAPAAGSHTITVQELNFTSTTATSASFTVSASTTPTIAVTTPSASIVGGTIALSGSYTLTAPTGINYYYDATGSYVAATGFAVNTTALTWSANTAADAPAAGSHTVTVQELNSTGTTATSGSFTTAAGNTFLPNNAKIIYSPYNWLVNASEAMTINAGAYFKTLFTGASVTLNFNVAGNSAPVPQLWYRIDGQPWVQVETLVASIALTMPTTTTAWPHHSLEVVVKSTSEWVTRWTPQDAAVILTGITLATGATLSTPFIPSKNVLIYGDSITEGYHTVNSNGSGANDCDGSDVLIEWSWLQKDLLGCNVGIVGFGGTGLINNGQGGVPPIQTSFNLLWSGQARTFSPAPDMIVINEGTNDLSHSAVTFQANFQIFLTELIAATVTCPIVVMEPFDGAQASAIQAAIAAVGSSRVQYIVTTGFFNTTDSVDAVHPLGVANIGTIAPQVAELLRPILYQSGAARSYVCS
jgi:hypothetical protein